MQSFAFLKGSCSKTNWKYTESTSKYEHGTILSKMFFITLFRRIFEIFISTHCHKKQTHKLRTQSIDYSPQLSAKLLFTGQGTSRTTYLTFMPEAVGSGLPVLYSLKISHFIEMNLQATMIRLQFKLMRKEMLFITFNTSTKNQDFFSSSKCKFMS